MTKPKTILVTFAGRKDRMQLLTRYVDAAMRRGLVDEWHVWDFSRNAGDARWLREKFPFAQVTPNDSAEYFRLPGLFSVRDAERRLRFSVCASNDVHIGLERRDPGTSYEVVVGGWGNQASAIRRFDNAAALLDLSRRDPAAPPHLQVPTPDVLPELGFTDMEVAFGPNGLRVVAGGKVLVEDATPVADGDYSVVYRTGFGSNGDWRFEQFPAPAQRLFVGRKSVDYPTSAMFYIAAYQYYAAQRDAHESDLFLKCDDDIVYVDLDRLRDFIAYRRAHEEHFLVSANVLNNGVCAHFQQQLGALPAQGPQFERPPGGLCGSLWASGAKAEALHRTFLSAPARFTLANPEAIVWNERVSINFIAFLGKDLVHIPDVMADDEHEMCYGVRKRARKTNCIYMPFVVAHLSFYKQEGEMNVADIIAGYDALAETKLFAPRSAAA